MGCAIPKIKVIGLVRNKIRHIIYGKHSAIRKYERFFFARGYSRRSKVVFPFLDATDATDAPELLIQKWHISPGQL